MENIATQWLIEKINSNLVSQANKNLELSNLKAELENLDLVKNIKLLELEIKGLWKLDTELREEWKQLLINTGIKKFEALDWTIIQLNKKPWALVIEDESISELEEYKKEKITITIDKKQLKEDITQWVIVPGVYITTDYSLVIKNNI